MNDQSQSLMMRFELWREEHLRELRQGGLLTGALALLGLILLLTAWMKPVDASPLIADLVDPWRFLTAALGFAVLAAAAVPLAFTLEHRERREGLMVLGQRWQELKGGRVEREARLRRLVLRFYGREAAE